MATDELQSKTFDFLRFPLIVGVIFIHTYGLGRGPEFVDVQPHTSLFYIINQLFSNVLGRIAVPLFFLMSGYLFYYKTEFNLSVYKKKLKSRSKSLLVPYLFWNAAVIIVYFVVSRIPYISSFFNNTTEYSFRYFVDCFWGGEAKNGLSCPIAYPLWFIRDLMVIVLFTPLIYRFLRYAGEIGLAILGLFWFCGLSIPYIGAYGFHSDAWFFFPLGAYFSINKKNLVSQCSVVGNYVYLLYVAVAIGDLATIGLGIIHGYIHNLGILIGIICCFKLSAYLIDKKGVRVSSFLSKASFFVFAIHEPWVLGNIRKIGDRLFYFSGDISMTLMYFVEVIITVFIALLIYYFMKKTMPRFTAIISGGR